MNGAEFLADTNAIIYLLSGNECMKPYLNARLSISVISFIEVLSYSALTEDDEKHIRDFMALCDLLTIDHSVREQTIRLRRQYRIKLPDAIIAATSICNNIPLITADVGFERVNELQVVRLTP